MLNGTNKQVINKYKPNSYHSASFFCWILQACVLEEESRQFGAHPQTQSQRHWIPPSQGVGSYQLFLLHYCCHLSS